MKKTIGYVVAGIGFLILVLSYPAIRVLIKIPSLGISDTYLMIIGAVILLAAAWIISKSSSEKFKEVPIYEGTGKNRRIVGMQRVSE